MKGKFVVCMQTGGMVRELYGMFRQMASRADEGASPVLSEAPIFVDTPDKFWQPSMLTVAPK